MEEDKESEEVPFFEEIVKKTKTGITFPRNLRDLLFEEDSDVFFRMVVPQAKDKIILEFLNEDQVKDLSEKLKTRKPTVVKATSAKKASKSKKPAQASPAWGEYFVYDFEAKNKIMPILESAFYKFAETPDNL